MARSAMNPKVDFYFNKEEKWQKEIEELRSIALDCGLIEELKWGCPCYSISIDKKKSNIVLIHVFKDYCAYLFFKGALLKDPESILIQQTENVQAARQIRFTDLKQIKKLESILKSYIFEAIEVERAGLKFEYKKTTEFAFPDEFKDVLNKDSELKSAFENLTPGRQRAYLLHFSSPKQSKTRESRIEKSKEAIMLGKGLND